MTCEDVEPEVAWTPEALSAGLVAESSRAPTFDLPAYTRHAVTAAMAIERERWVTDLEAALRDVPDTASSSEHHHWRARVRGIVDEKIAEEREACAHLAERGLWDRTAAECSGECGADIAKAIRARVTLSGRTERVSSSGRFP